MSKKNQEHKMKRLAALSRCDLGYLSDPDGNPVTGDKKVWLNTGKAFLRALARDLELSEFKVWANPGGIAVNGESILMGMWGEGNGIFVELVQEIGGCGCVMYRDIIGMKDYTGGRNRWIGVCKFESMSYDSLLTEFKELIHQRTYAVTA
ncbi:MAG: hypothetical protein LBS19_09740 [Clostridiales bacterium]|jgi:hypothetical protein|nr:hypothetical protein [Clostridiales bacterium]